MIVLPAIDLHRGRCVRLHQGRFDSETVYADDPLAVARGFAAAGARWLHMVDLDGAKDGASAQGALVKSVAGAVDMRLQVGGGIRSEATIRDYLDGGVARVVIGSLALSNPSLVGAWLKSFGRDRIVIALDVRRGEDGVYRLATHGWQRDAKEGLFDLLDRHVGAGLRHLLCTDIARDGALTGPNLKLYAEIGRRHPGLAVQASGGVAALADLTALAAGGVAAAIVGKALYEARFTLAEALAAGGEP